MTDEPDRVDCLRFPGDAADAVRLVPAGMGDRIVAAHREEARRRRRVSYVAVVVVALLTAGAAVLTLGVTTASVVGTALVVGVLLFTVHRGVTTPTPELVATDLHAEEARDRYDVTVATTDPVSRMAASDAETGPPDDES